MHDGAVVIRRAKRRHHAAAVLSELLHTVVSDVGDDDAHVVVAVRSRLLVDVAEAMTQFVNYGTFLK